MRPWHWIATIVALVAAYILVPESWSPAVPWVAAFLIASHFGGRIDECMSRISRLEAEVAAHEFALDKHKKALLLEIPDRLYDLQKRLDERGI